MSKKLLLQQDLPSTVLKLTFQAINLLLYVYMLQQDLPSTVLKLIRQYPIYQYIYYVATGPTVYGIETSLESPYSRARP